MTKLYSVRFDDRPFRTSHMKAPTGRGSWAFAFEDMGTDEDPWFAPGGLTLGEAKKLAKAEALKRAAAVDAPVGATLYVDVLP